MHYIKGSIIGYFAKIFLSLTFILSLLSAESFGVVFSPGEGHTILPGTGYHTVSGDTRGDCVVGVETKSLMDCLSGQCNSSGQWVEHKMKLIEKSSELKDALDMNAQASLGLGIFSSEARVRYFSEAVQKNDKVFFFVSTKVKNLSHRLTEFRLTDFARQLLSAQRFQEFENRCGDEFVASITTGGHFIGILEITTHSEADKAEVAASLRMSGIGSKAEVDFNNKLESISKSHDMEYSVFKNGNIQDIPDPTPAALIRAARQFPRTVSLHSGNAWIVSVSTTGYNSVNNLPNSPSLSYIAQRRILNTLAEYQNTVFDKLKSVSTVLQRSGDFVEVNYGALSNYQRTYHHILHQIQDAAQRCEENPKRCNLPSIQWPDYQEPQKKKPIEPVIPPVIPKTKPEKTTFPVGRVLDFNLKIHHLFGISDRGPCGHWQLINRETYNYCQNLGYVAGLTNTVFGTIGLGSKEGKLIVREHATPQQIRDSGWDFTDDRDFFNWSKAYRAAITICGSRGYIAGFFDGHIGPQLERGLICVGRPGSEEVKRMHASPDDIHRTGYDFEEGDFSFLSPAYVNSLNAAHQICRINGFVTGFFDGHIGPSRERGLICLR